MNPTAEPHRTLILGGARSGKSAHAEALLAADRDVIYIATAPRYPGDAEWDERIARHQADRPATWHTVETGREPDRLADVLRAADRPVLVDCLTLWLTAAMDQVGAWNEDRWHRGDAAIRLGALTGDVVSAFAAARVPAVAVSNEVGFGLVPQTPGTRRFRDELGRLNQAFAAAAHEATLVVAGLPVPLKRRVT
jgi:adenosylcobinamide kinase / adenosylcobinamide-phosphate guanylyltransferase